MVQRVDKEQILLSGKGLDENGLDMMMLIMITSDLWWPKEQRKASSFEPLRLMALEET